MNSSRRRCASKAWTRYGRLATSTATVAPTRCSPPATPSVAWTVSGPASGRSACSYVDAGTTYACNGTATAFASVNATGTLANSKNVTAVALATTGVYCLKLASTPSVGVASLRGDAAKPGSAEVLIPAKAVCGASGDTTAEVLTYDASGTAAGLPFDVLFDSTPTRAAGISSMRPPQLLRARQQQSDQATVAYRPFPQSSVTCLGRYRLLFVWRTGDDRRFGGPNRRRLTSVHDRGYLADGS